jgi:hypothetical protein
MEFDKKNLIKQKLIFFYPLKIKYNILDYCFIWIDYKTTRILLNFGIFKYDL